MTQEDKQLLKDLSARFPYGTIVSVTDGTIKYNAYIESISYKNIQVSPVSDSNFTAYTFYKISEIKPYLRSMSSMTEEEYKELKLISPYYGFAPYKFIGDWCPNYEMVDWCNKNHFDFRGLIPKGLAIEAPEGMYK